MPDIYTGTVETWRSLKRDHERLKYELDEVRRLVQNYRHHESAVPTHRWLVQVTSTLYPGSSAGALRIIYRGGQYITTDQAITIYDPLVQTFALGPWALIEGEGVWVEFNRETRQWESVSEFGLKRLVKTDASHDKGAVGTCSVYRDLLGVDTDTTINLPLVKNKFADLESGAWAWAEFDHYRWYLTAGECEVPA